MFPSQIATAAAFALVFRLAVAASQGGCSSSDTSSCPEEEDVQALLALSRTTRRFVANNAESDSVDSDRGPIFKIPHPVSADSNIRLRLTSTRIEVPLSKEKGAASQTVYTRGYGVCGRESSMPGPTIRVKPGQLLAIDLENRLTYPDPDCLSPDDPGYDWRHTYCRFNTTNFHTHGLHVSPHKGSDDIFEELKPWNTSKTEEVPVLPVRIQLPEDHMGGTFWYHAHHHHSTSLQAGGGALGALIVDDPPGSLPEEIEKMPEVVAVITFLNAQIINRVANNGDVSDTMRDALSGTSSTFKGALVNGDYQPEAQMKSGVWYRFRMIFASIVQSLAIGATGSEATCDFELLAKDGVYLHTAPRKIKRVYLGSGNRADVAVRCTCKNGKACSFDMASTPRAKDVSPGPLGNGGERANLNGFPVNPFQNLMSPMDAMGTLSAHHAVLNQTLMKINIEAPSLNEGPQPDLKKFKLARPCYLVDLRKAKESQVEKHTVGLQSPGSPTSPRMTFDGNGKPFSLDAPPVANLTLPSVQEWHLVPISQSKDPTDHEDLSTASSFCGVRCHPFHLHVTPFQLQDFQQNTHMDPYFQNGDWHDTFINGIQDSVTVRFQLERFTGKTVMHCHYLLHEDLGMENYVQVDGSEGDEWKPARSQIDPTCYNSRETRRNSKKFTYVPCS